MNKQDEAIFQGEKSPVEDTQVAFHREDYSDAHFERAEESTVPPRYYTPPDRSVRPARKNSREKKSVGLICTVLGAAILGGLAGSVITGTAMERQIGSLESRLTEVETILQETISLAEASDSVERAVTDAGFPAEMKPSDIYAQATKLVVGVRTEYTVTNFFGMTSSGAVSGSGFLISEDGYILTNFHVVEEAFNRGLRIEVITYDGSQYTASIVGVESANDIAVLKIDAEGLSAAEFGDSDTLLVGDTVYAVGNPLGELEFSMSTGHVSALDRVIKTQESEEINMFQVDAAVNEGNSGGPVFNTAGKVIGIVTAKYSSSGVEGLGFAIPINDARSIANDLITKGYVTGKAFMGVSLDNRYNSMYSQYYGTPLGAFVSGVTPGSAAERAGIQSGDIITAIGDYSVAEYNDLKSALRHFSAFDNTEITVYRSGAELHIPLTFDEATPENH